MGERARTRVRRIPKRASYESETIAAILDEALICHVATAGPPGAAAGRGAGPPGAPPVIPTLHARDGEHVYLHGSSASRTLREAGRVEICLTATLIDGLVLARSAMHHSVNYRSVVLFGEAELIEEEDEKLRALRAFTEKLLPGRWEDVRAPTELELRATAVLRVPLAEASAKLRSGGPLDDEADYELPVWAGVVDLELSAGAVHADARLLPGVEQPSYVSALAAGER